MQKLNDREQRKAEKELLSRFANLSRFGMVSRLSRLRERGLAGERSLALREFALGIGAGRSTIIGAKPGSPERRLLELRGGKHSFSTFPVRNDRELTNEFYR